MSKEMLISTLEGHECRIAVVDSGRLQELYVERSSSASHVGNIYKGKITNIESAIQAAFVDFGLGKNGFLHISDVHPKFFPGGKPSTSESVGRKRAHHHRPPIQECLKRGQEIVVQMIKEGIGTKGPTLTTYLSLPGRMLVMMPGMSRLGVSRKIEDDELRAKAKVALDELTLPPDTGFILRTAGIGRPKRELQRDLNYLVRLWEDISKKTEVAKTPSEIYRESDLVVRTLRDVYNTEIKRIICDRGDDAKKVGQFLNMVLPRGRQAVEVYTGSSGLFSDYGLEEEIERMYACRVELPSGGSLVIDQAEALVAIDVNSGRFRDHNDAETTALKTDLEAAREIARQLRIRDLGGVIVIDFIDLRQARNCQKVERELKEAIKPDRAKTKILRMSQFGIVEMTRQRMRPSLRQSIYRTCAHCDGDGVIKSEESQTIHIMRCLDRLCANPDVAKIEVGVTSLVADHLSNNHRKQLTEMEQASGKTITIRARADLAGNDVRITCANARGSNIAWETAAKRGQGKSGDVKVETVALKDLDKLPEPTQPEGAPAEATEGEPGEKPKAKKRSRRRKPKAAEAESKDAPVAEAPPASEAEPEAKAETAESEEAETKVKKSRRRGRRGGKKHRRKTGAGDAPADESGEAVAEDVAKTDTEAEAETSSASDAAADELRADCPLADWVDDDQAKD